VVALLTNTELDFLVGKREFTKPQKRYLKCRLSKKVNDFVNNELLLLQKKGYLLLPLSSVAASCNGNSDNGSSIAACCNAELTNSNKNGAGSGNFVPLSPHPQRGREGNISNPRVLSDMGLAIPRPTRLGDPRSSSDELLEIEIPFANPCPKGHVGSSRRSSPAAAASRFFCIPKI
jgi:hypothetical protein